MKRSLWKCLAVMFVLVYSSSAFAFDLVTNAYNGSGFRNSEILLNSNGEFYDDETHQLTVGDIFCGVLDVTSVVGPSNEYGQTGSDIWDGSNNEVTGYFATQITQILPLGAADPGNPTIVMGPVQNDPFGILNTQVGEVIRLFEDPQNNYDDSTQNLAFSTATDGTHLWSLGLGASEDGDSPGGYWYTVGPVNPPTQGDIGQSYAGLNFISNAGPAPTPGGSQFKAINDPNENFSSLLITGAAGNGLDADVWFNSELFAMGNNITDQINMHFGSNDPAVVHPVPVPGVIWLLGSGLAGLLGFRRKITCS